MRSTLPMAIFSLPSVVSYIFRASSSIPKILSSTCTGALPALSLMVFTFTTPS